MPSRVKLPEGVEVVENKDTRTITLWIPFDDGTGREMFAHTELTIEQSSALAGKLIGSGMGLIIDKWSKDH